MTRFYTPDELAQVLSVDAAVVLDLVASGRLRAYRIGEHVRISETDLQQYLETAIVSTPHPAEQPAAAPPSAETRKECPTFGGQASFTYLGSVATGTTIWPSKKASYKLVFDAAQWALLLDTFRGKEFRAGLNFAKPEPGSLGAWIKEHWNTKMGPAAYVGGILISEGYADRPKPGWIRVFGQAQAASSNNHQ
jgi:excisionase family DNA binding protein